MFFQKQINGQYILCYVAYIRKGYQRKKKNSISPIDNPLYLTMYVPIYYSLVGAFPFHLAFTNNCLTNLLSQKQLFQHLIYTFLVQQLYTHFFFNLCLYQQQLSTRALQLVIVLLGYNKSFNLSQNVYSMLHTYSRPFTPFFCL